MADPQMVRARELMSQNGTVLCEALAGGYTTPSMILIQGVICRAFDAERERVARELESAPSFGDGKWAARIVRESANG